MTKHYVTRTSKMPHFFGDHAPDKAGNHWSYQDRYGRIIGVALMTPEGTMHGMKARPGTCWTPSELREAKAQLKAWAKQGKAEEPA